MNIQELRTMASKLDQYGAGVTHLQQQGKVTPVEAMTLRFLTAAKFVEEGATAQPKLSGAPNQKPTNP